MVGWPPVMAVAELSMMSTVMLVFAATASSSGVMPGVHERAVADHGDGRAGRRRRRRPCAMPIEAPMQTHDSMARVRAAARRACSSRCPTSPAPRDVPAIASLSASKLSRVRAAARTVAAGGWAARARRSPTPGRAAQAQRGAHHVGRQLAVRRHRAVRLAAAISSGGGRSPRSWRSTNGYPSSSTRIALDMGGELAHLVGRGSGRRRCAGETARRASSSEVLRVVVAGHAGR